MKKRIIMGAVAVLAWSGLMAGSAMALMIDHGTTVSLVDGADRGSTINLLSSDMPLNGYDLRYSLNGADWSLVDNLWNSFEGGGVLDFALAGQTPDEFYVLSNDVNDSNFSATMQFLSAVEPSQAQQPLMTTPYYRDLLITWNIGDITTYSNSLALPSLSWSNLRSGNVYSDGVAPVIASAPVPEPGTMIILGTCLLCLGGAASRKKKRQ